jgi:hypothetical protein
MPRLSATSNGSFFSVSLRRLDAEVNNDWHIRPACLPSPDLVDYGEKPPSFKFTVTGFGRQEFGNSEKHFWFLIIFIPGVRDGFCLNPKDRGIADQNIRILQRLLLLGNVKNSFLTDLVVRINPKFY